MEIQQYHDIAEFDQSANWWYTARRSYLNRLVRRFAPVVVSTALDVGCGTGANVSVLRSRAKKVIGLDPSEAALLHARGNGYDECVQAGIEHMPFGNDSVDLVLCADVLEHVDDGAALDELHRVMRKGGVIVVNVPAFMSLWHGNDDYSQHVRRYARRELIENFAAHGFLVQHVRFWNQLFFVPVWITARLYRRESSVAHQNNLSSIPGLCNPLLTAWMRAETYIADLLPLPFGVSLVLVAKKQ